MSRLSEEWQRLYGRLVLNGVSAASERGSTLLDAQGRTRALVIDVRQPSGWAALASLWDGVQRELAWPAPAIAVNGSDAFQLWFSLAEPTAADVCMAAGQALIRRFLPELPASDVRVWPQGDTHAVSVPLEHEAGQWSAFVSPGLAPVFADTPWLDIPPGEDGQADLLSGVTCVTATQLSEAMAPAPVHPAPSQASLPAAGVQAEQIGQTSEGDPRAFLLRVMNDERVDLALRIEAAKALLPHHVPAR